MATPNIYLDIAEASADCEEELKWFLHRVKEIRLSAKNTIIYCRSRKVMISLLMITAWAAKVSDQEMSSKFVCSGESILLFEKENIIADGHLFSLYIYKEEWKLIASWESVDTLKNIGSYVWKVFFDGYGNLVIGNIDQTGEGQYRVQQRQGAKIIHSYNQKLTVMAAPTTNCKPKINIDGRNLVASLEYTECGKPEPSLYFVDQSHFAYVTKTAENTTLATFSPGNEAGTYIACIDTPAVRCATNRKLFDLCSYITVPERSKGTISTDPMIDIRVCVYLNTIIVSAVLILYMISFIRDCISTN